MSANRTPKEMKRILLTTGDREGVGCEITVKALNRVSIPRSHQVFVYCGVEEQSQLIRSIRGASREKPRDLDSAFRMAASEKKSIYVIGSHDLPPHWVEEAAYFCLDGRAKALVTGPLSKPLIRKAGMKDLGHTEILARVSGSSDLFMSFWGPKLNVVLLTGHVPLKEVPRRLTPQRLTKAWSLTRKFLEAWSSKEAQKPMALLGINPHAGDRGLIGDDEAWMRKWVAIRKGSVMGPLPGDSAFTEDLRKKFSVYLASYHDEGLIPFKLLHGFDEGVHVTLGLPFLRTSVDHGPAQDLFGLGKANPGSMKSALAMAIRAT